MKPSKIKSIVGKHDYVTSGCGGLGLPHDIEGEWGEEGPDPLAAVVLVLEHHHTL